MSEEIQTSRDVTEYLEITKKHRIPGLDVGDQWPRPRHGEEGKPR